MTDACLTFRAALTAALANSHETRELGWHEHLLACGACRELLAGEEALELLLATLPEPELPRDLAERILARLAGERDEEELDALLAHDPAPVAPPRLAGRILAGLERERAQPASDPLDALLVRLPEPAVPPTLARTILDGLGAERRPERKPAGRLLRFVRESPATVLLLAASLAFFVLAFEVWRRRQPADETARPDGGNPAPNVAVAPRDEDVDPELLANLDLLENWELLTTDDVDFLLGTLEPVDVAILESIEPAEEEEG